MIILIEYKQNGGTGKNEVCKLKLVLDIHKAKAVNCHETSNNNSCIIMATENKRRFCDLICCGSPHCFLYKDGNRKQPLLFIQFK